jgi:hypothetical protein
VSQNTRNLASYKIKRKSEYTAEVRRAKEKYSITSGCGRK